MPQSNQILVRRLNTYKISRDRYETETALLIDMGFSKSQADSIIIRRCSSNTTQAILNNCSLLLATPYNLDHEQIVRIASNIGGSKNIEAVKADYIKLERLGFTTTQIVSMAGCDGGSKNIEAVKDNFYELQCLGFTTWQIFSIVRHDGGSKNIEAVKEVCNELKGLGFTVSHIALIADNPGGGGGQKTLR